MVWTATSLLSVHFSVVSQKPDSLRKEVLDSGGRLLSLIPLFRNQQSSILVVAPRKEFATLRDGRTVRLTARAVDYLVDLKHLDLLWTLLVGVFSYSKLSVVVATPSEQQSTHCDGKRMVLTTADVLHFYFEQVSSHQANALDVLWWFEHPRFEVEPLPTKLTILILTPAVELTLCSKSYHVLLAHLEFDHTLLFELLWFGNVVRAISLVALEAKLAIRVVSPDVSIVVV